MGAGCGSGGEVGITVGLGGGGAAEGLEWEDLEWESGRGAEGWRRR